jgi:hypothetical protein
VRSIQSNGLTNVVSEEISYPSTPAPGQDQTGRSKQVDISASRHHANVSGDDALSGRDGAQIHTGDLDNCHSALHDLHSLVRAFPASQDSLLGTSNGAPSLKHMPSLPALPALRSSVDLQDLINAALNRQENLKKRLEEAEDDTRSTFEGSLSTAGAVAAFNYVHDISQLSINDALRRSFDSDDSSRAENEVPLDVPQSPASSFQHYLDIGRPGVSSLSPHRTSSYIDRSATR